MVDFYEIAIKLGAPLPPKVLVLVTLLIIVALAILTIWQQWPLKGPTWYLAIATLIGLIAILYYVRRSRSNRSLEPAVIVEPPMKSSTHPPRSERPRQRLAPRPVAPPAH